MPGTHNRIEPTPIAPVPEMTLDYGPAHAKCSAKVHMKSCATILLVILMQVSLFAQGGVQAKGMLEAMQNNRIEIKAERARLRVLPSSKEQDTKLNEIDQLIPKLVEAENKLKAEILVATTPEDVTAGKSNKCPVHGGKMEVRTVQIGFGLKIDVDGLGESVRLKLFPYGRTWHWGGVHDGRPLSDASAHLCLQGVCRSRKQLALQASKGPIGSP